MALANLPGRNERSAPKFDETHPDELDPYLDDIQDLLDRYNIIDHAEQKLAAVKYLKTRTSKLWKTTAAWSDAAKTYDEFKEEVIGLYPGARGDRTYTIQDLDLILGHYARTGILSSVDLGEYYRRFLLVSRYLISKNRLSTQEQSRSFFRGLQPQLEAKTMQRLAQKFIDHWPDDPYPLSDTYEAVSYVLMGSATTILQPTQQVPTPSAAAPSPPSTADLGVKNEMAALTAAVTSAVANLSEMFKHSLQPPQAGPRPRVTGANAMGTSVPGTSACNFCGLPGHFIRECEVVAEYTRAGKCKRSQDGRVVLPSGAMVPRSITGTWLRDRVDEYHRQNPGQMAAQMLLEVAATATAPPNDAAGQSKQSYPARHASQYINENVARAYALRRPLPPRPEVVITTRPPRHSGRAGQGENAGGANSEETPQVQREVEHPTGAPESSTAKKGKHVEFAPEPTHPYATVPDATHGAVIEPFRTAAKPPAAGRHDPAYTTTAKAYDPLIAKAVCERAMDATITVTQRELLSLSPEVRTQIADITVRKRMAREQAAMAMVEDVTDEEDETFLRSLEQAQATQAAHMPAAFATAARIPPANATIIADPFEAYLRDGSTETKAADPFHVAAESNALRAILPIVDGQDKIEAILDPGCQIVAMSEEVCNALALPYDPVIRLNMVSANGGVDQSLGLARNVPFLVGEITLYLQVHVLRAPAYDILLGRPFDVLTQSVVRNFTNENQTVTILDPNTNKKATVPTIQRGTFRFADRRASKASDKAQDF